MGPLRVVAGVLLTAVATVAVAVATATSAPARHTIRVDPIGVAFDIPRGFAAVQTDITEGGWAGIISFAWEVRPRHLSVIPVRVVFWPTGYAFGGPVPDLTPSQYIDAELRRVNEERGQGRGGYTGGPDRIVLLGNRAVRYSFTGLDDQVVVIGYLRPAQLPPDLRARGGEFLVRIDAEAYSAAKEIFDSVVGSIRTFRSSELRTAGIVGAEK